jgi:four helix bundle protein
MRGFKKLKVWQQTHHLALFVYRVTGAFPISEADGLSTQMRELAISIPARIARGYSMGTRADLRQCCEEACLAAHQLETLIDLAYDLRHTSVDVHDYLLLEVKRAQTLLQAFIDKLD